MTPAFTPVELIDRLGARAGALAEAVSLAIRIEPQLLRRARIELFPNLDAGTEADVWFSPVVETRAASGIVLRPPVTHALRQRLATRPAMLDAAWAIVESLHRNISPAIFAEERLAYLALSGRHAEMRELLRSVVAALSSRRGRSLAPWAARAVRTLPDEAKFTQEAQMISFGAALRLEDAPFAGGIPLARAAEWAGWLSPDDLDTVPFGVTLLEDAVEFGIVGRPLSHRLDFPKTVPVAADLSWKGGHKRIVLDPNKTIVVDLGTPLDEVEIRTVLGDAYTLAGPERIVRLDDPKARAAAALALGQIKSEAVVAPLIACLDDSDQNVRAAAAQALGQIKSKAAVARLIARLDDSDQNVRAAAAQALGQIKSKAAVAPLIARLDDKDPNVRAAAAHALGLIDPEAALAPQPGGKGEIVMHDRFLKMLLAVATVRLVASYTDAGLGFDPDSLQVFLPDMHLLSAERRKLYQYGTNYADTLLVDLVAGLTEVRTAAHAKGKRVNVFHIGDYLDLLRQSLLPALNAEVPDQIKDSHPELTGLLEDPALNTHFLLGNHDFELYRFTGYSAWERRFFLPGDDPRVVVMHGDYFDWVDRAVGEEICDVAVFFFSQQHPADNVLIGKMRDLTHRFNPPANAQFIQLQSPAVLGSLTPHDESAEIPANYNLQEPGSASEDALKFLDKACEECANVNRANGSKLRMVIIGHTHHARIAAKTMPDGTPFALVDIGAWIENCIQEKDGPAVPNAQIAALAANQVRIYQLAPK